MSILYFENTKDTECFAFKYYIIGNGRWSLKRKVSKFDNLFNGISFYYSLELNDIVIPNSKLTIYNKETKKRIMSGTIHEIYANYLQTYANKINVEDIHNLSYKGDIQEHPSIKRLKMINEAEDLSIF
jgi:hypothetical protein